MTQMKHFDVAITGAGVTGVLLAMKLAALGLAVILVELQDKIAGGPSTRNEGWLHNGTLPRGVHQRPHTGDPGSPPVHLRP